MDFAELLRRLNTDLTGLANSLRRLLTTPMSNGYLVSGTLEAGSLFSVVPHGMGRVYQGGIVVSLTEPNAGLIVAPPSEAESMGLRPDQHIVLITDVNVSMTDNAFTLWVF